MASNGTDEGDRSRMSRVAGIGFEAGVGVALGVIVGWWLDRHFGWSPWGTVIGALLGLAAGMYLLIRDALRANKD